MGYVPRIQIRNDVYLGDAVVSNGDGTAYIGIINSGETDCTISIPTVELQEIALISKTCSPENLTSKLENASNNDRENGDSDIPALGPGKTKKVAVINQTFGRETP